MFTHSEAFNLWSNRVFVEMDGPAVQCNMLYFIHLWLRYHNKGLRSMVYNRWRGTLHHRCGVVSESERALQEYRYKAGRQPNAGSFIEFYMF